MMAHQTPSIFKTLWNHIIAVSIRVSHWGVDSCIKWQHSPKTRPIFKTLWHHSIAVSILVSQWVVDSRTEWQHSPKILRYHHWRRLRRKWIPRQLLSHEVPKATIITIIHCKIRRLQIHLQFWSCTLWF